MFCLKDFMYVLSFSLRIYSLHVTRSAGKLQVWPHLVKKPLMKNFISCAVQCIPSAEKADVKMTLVLNFFQLSKVCSLSLLLARGN